jgi:hypothetical protein
MVNAAYYGELLDSADRKEEFLRECHVLERQGC